MHSRVFFSPHLLASKNHHANITILQAGLHTRLDFFSMTFHEVLVVGWAHRVKNLIGTKEWHVRLFLNTCLQKRICFLNYRYVQSHDGQLHCKKNYLNLGMFIWIIVSVNCASKYFSWINSMASNAEIAVISNFLIYHRFCSSRCGCTGKSQTKGILQKTMIILVTYHVHKIMTEKNSTQCLEQSL